MEDAARIQSGFFPALARFIKAPEYKESLKEALIIQLEILNEHLERKGTKYFAGSNISLVDFSLAPKLYHMNFTLEEFYPDVHQKMKTYSALNCYMETMFNENAFQITSYPRDTVLWGWSNARGGN